MVAVVVVQLSCFHQCRAAWRQKQPLASSDDSIRAISAGTRAKPKLTTALATLSVHLVFKYQPSEPGLSGDKPGWLIERDVALFCIKASRSERLHLT